MRLSAQWIWGSEQYPNAYCCFRRAFEAPEPALRAVLRITADTSYMAWLNGRYIGQGPGPFVRNTRPVDEYDLTDIMRGGTNLLAVLGNWWGVRSHSRPEGNAGLLAELLWEGADGVSRTLGTDDGWLALLSDAWERDVPRRNWAMGWTEYYDARRESVGWNSLDFDDSDWERATVVEVEPRNLFPRHRPLLREHTESPVGLVGAWRTVPDSPGPEDDPDLTEFLDREPLEPISDSTLNALESGLKLPAPQAIEGLSAEHGLAFTLDMGREITGHIELDIEAPAGGRVEIAPAELLREGRPWCYRKRTRYAGRYITREGRQRWRSFGWHGLRYLHVVLRGFDAPVTVHHLGVWRREADLPWRARFSSSDDTLERIWHTGVHTLKVGTQEVHVDCPTREQAAYWGDAAWIGLWTLAHTGDASHLRHLLLSAEPAQLDDGQLPASIFSSLGQILFDYTLVFPWALREWWWHTGDLGVPRRLDEVVEGVLDWYRERIGPVTGLVEIDAIASQEQGEGTLFIDHPGLGWHNFPHPGIDRRGISAGLNLFLLRALQCRAELLEAMDRKSHAVRTTAEAEALAQRIEAAFFDSEQGVYVDALVDGRQSEQVSQQINALAVLTGVCPPERSRSVLERVTMSREDAPDLCRCSPYFWIYLAEAMAEAGMHREMLDTIRDLWGKMAEAGATTWWETFAGDELDSLCHPWSSVPNHAIQRHLLGIGCAAAGFERAVIHPRPDLISRASGTLYTVSGPIEVSWMQTENTAEQTPGGVELIASVPGGVEARVIAPEGWRIDDHEEVTVPEGSGAWMTMHPGR